MIPRPYATFVLRVWIEPAGDGGEADGVWRASVTDTRSRERFHFSEPADLLLFLTGSPPRPPPRLPTEEEETPC